MIRTLSVIENRGITDTVTALKYVEHQVFVVGDRGLTEAFDGRIDVYEYLTEERGLIDAAGETFRHQHHREPRHGGHCVATSTVDVFPDDRGLTDTVTVTRSSDRTVTEGPWPHGRCGRRPEQRQSGPVRRVRGPPRPLQTP